MHKLRKNIFIEAILGRKLEIILYPTRLIILFMAEKDGIPKWKLASAAAIESIGLLQGAAEWQKKVAEKPVTEYHSEYTAERHESETIWKDTWEPLMTQEEKNQKEYEKSHNEAMENAEVFEFTKQKERERIKDEIDAQDEVEFDRTKLILDDYNENIEFL